MEKKIFLMEKCWNKKWERKKVPLWGTFSERKNFRKVFVACFSPSWEKDAGANSPELPKSSCVFACCFAVLPCSPPNCLLRKKRLCQKGLCFIIIFYILSILFTKLIFYNFILCLQNLLIFLYKIQNLP